MSVIDGYSARCSRSSIYDLRSRQGQIWMLTVYYKTEATSIPAHMLKKIKRKSMARRRRNIGLEILQGIRQLKRGEHGRVINVPSVSGIREKTDCRSRSSPSCWAFRFVRCRSGSKVGAHHPGPREHCS